MAASMRATLLLLLVLVPLAAAGPLYLSLAVSDKSDLSSGIESINLEGQYEIPVPESLRDNLACSCSWVYNENQFQPTRLQATTARPVRLPKRYDRKEIGVMKLMGRLNLPKMLGTMGTIKEQASKVVADMYYEFTSVLGYQVSGSVFGDGAVGPVELRKGFVVDGRPGSVSVVHDFVARQGTMKIQGLIDKDTECSLDLTPDGNAKLQAMHTRKLKGGTTAYVSGSVLPFVQEGINAWGRGLVVVGVQLPALLGDLSSTVSARVDDRAEMHWSLRSKLQSSNTLISGRVNLSSPKDSASVSLRYGLRV